MGKNYYEKRNLYTDEELVNAYLKYHSQTKAAKELGVSYTTVWRAVCRCGIARDGRKNNRGTQPCKAGDEELKSDVNAGLCVAEIANKYNMHPARAANRLRKIGETASGTLVGGNYCRRTRRYGISQYDDSIDLKAVIDKYAGICQICGEAVDEKDKYGRFIHGKYPTVDHIVPISKGGTHTWENVQLAHMSCNARKGDKIDVERRRVCKI